jgi:hypothetical protein
MTDATEDAARGQTLHREFVGMLFALAIAEVAVRSGAIINSDLDSWTKAPALSHLFLASMVIATSWVGWGWSKHSLSNVRHVFTKDFVELALDVWLVGVYFFIVQGAETIADVQGGTTIQGSVEVEALWIMVMFGTYVIWDVWTKWGKWPAFAQRAWASIMCAGFAAWTFFQLRELRGIEPVVLGDVSLLAIVFLFRAMKIHDFTEHTRRSWALIAALLILWIVTTRSALAG